jgi:UrcA family protein
MHRSISIIAAAAAMVSATSPCFAQEVHTASVMIHASDFATPRARAALDHRIQLAAEDLCGVNGAAENESWGEIKRCQAGVREELNLKIASLKTSGEIQLSAR